MSHGSMPKVCAVVCTIARPAGLRACVQSMLSTSYPNLDVVVVDQDRSGASREAIAGLITADPRVHHLFTPIAGKTRAQNLALATFDADIYAFTDDDCVVPSDWVNCIAEAFSQQPDAEMLFGQVLQPPDAEGDVIPALPIEAAARLSGDGSFRIYGMGCDMAVRRSLFERIGTFDEALGVGGPLRGSGEDFDFQYRAVSAGAIVLLRPEIKVDHYGGRTLAQWHSDAGVYGRGDGAFFMKHIRCRDWRATKMFVRWAGRDIVREALIRVRLWRRPSRGLYMSGFWRGVLASRRLRVDRERRLYVLPDARRG